MNGTALFNTVPQNDYLTLFPSGAPDYEKVVRVLDFKKKDVARASNIAIHSVRYDPPRMPKELQDRLTEWAMAMAKVAEYFHDGQKTVLWFRAPNPLLGNISPREMIRVGRFKKLYSFIMTALAENEPPRR